MVQRSPGSLPLARGTAPTAPGPVARERLYLSGDTTSPSYHLYMFGRWVNISEFVMSANWTHGQLIPHRIGVVMQPAQGALVLDDTDGVFNTFNPAAGIDPHPGVPIEIWSGSARSSGDILFRGWTRGVVTTITDADVYVTALPIYSAQIRLSEIQEGFFLRVSGRQTPSTVFQLALQNLEWSGGSLVQESTLPLISNYLSGQPALGSGRTLASFQALCRLLAVLEGSRIYDDRQGRMVFENFSSRQVVEGHRVHRISVDDPFAVTTLDPDQLVVNAILGESDNAVSAGVQDLEFTASLPQRFTIPPNTLDWGLVLEIKDPDILFIESWSPLVDGTHFTWTYTATGAVATPTFHTDSRSCRIVFPNPTNYTQQVQILRIEGEPFKRSFNSLVIERDQRSIDLYGLKEVRYPAITVGSQAQVQARARYWLEQYAGVGPDGNRQPKRSVKLTLREPEEEVYDISDLVYLSWASPFKQFTEEWPFWIDEVKHDHSSEGVHTVELMLVDAAQSGAREVILGDVHLNSRPVEIVLGDVQIYQPHPVETEEHILGDVRL